MKRATHFWMCLGVLLLVASAAANGQTPSVSAVSPAQNAVNVSLGSNISVTFDVDMNDVSIGDSSFMVSGSLTGRKSGTITYDAPSKTATFDPDVDFYCGETVTATVTTSVMAFAGSPMAFGYTWTFSAEVVESDGYLALDTSYSCESSPKSVDVADFDGDGDVDIAVSLNMGCDPGMNAVSVRWNNGQGLFDTDTAVTTGQYPYFLEVADFNMDGSPDIMVAVDDIVPLIRLTLNDGTGHFGYPNSVISDDINVFNRFSCGDYNGDGYPDLAIGHSDSYDAIVIYENNGDGTFGSASEPYAYETQLPTWINSSDLDGDGDQDIAVTTTVNDDAIIWPNDGGGTFGTSIQLTMAGESSAISSGDVDLDGDRDLIIQSWYGPMIVFENEGSLSFNPVDYQPCADWSPALADIDGDADLDFIWGNWFEGIVTVRYNTYGAFPTSAEVDAGDYPWQLATADLNDDGKLDIVVANENCGNPSSLSILLNQTCFDSDGDGYGDPGHPENGCPEDNCPFITNTDQEDEDGNGLGDACQFWEETLEGWASEVYLTLALLTYSYVGTAGTSWLELTWVPPGTPPSAVQVEPIGLPMYYCTDTEAEYVPPIEVCLTYDTTHISTDENLMVFQWTGSEWNELTILSHDTLYDQICVEVDSLTCFVIASPLPYMCGDANGSQAVDIDDVVHLINYIFAGGASPDPYESGDANCSGAVDIDDVVYLIGYIFSGGFAPCDTDGDEIPDC